MPIFFFQIPIDSPRGAQKTSQWPSPDYFMFVTPHSQVVLVFYHKNWIILSNFLIWDDAPRNKKKVENPQEGKGYF